MNQKSFYYKYLKYKTAYDKLLSQLKNLDGGVIRFTIETNISYFTLIQLIPRLLKTDKITELINSGIRIDDRNLLCVNKPPSSSISFKFDTDYINEQDYDIIKNEILLYLEKYTEYNNLIINKVSNSINENAAIDYFSEKSTDEIARLILESQKYLDKEKTILHILVRKGFIQTLEFLRGKFDTDNKLDQFRNFFDITDDEGRTIFMIATHPISNHELIFNFARDNTKEQILYLNDKNGRNASDWFILRNQNNSYVCNELQRINLIPNHYKAGLVCDVQKIDIYDEKSND